MTDMLKLAGGIALGLFVGFWADEVRVNSLANWHEDRYYEMREQILEELKFYDQGPSDLNPSTYVRK